MSWDGIDSDVGKRDVLMFRIASLFLLQTLKGSKSGDAPDFNNIETLAVIKFFSPCKARPEGNSSHSDTDIKGTFTIIWHRQNWVAQFKCGDFSTCGAPRPGRSKTVTTPEIIINQIHELILEHRRISAKSIAEQLGISREWDGSIIHEDLVMRNFSAKWVKNLGLEFVSPQEVKQEM
jgi:hypothetical protein